MKFHNERTQVARTGIVPSALAVLAVSLCLATPAFGEPLVAEVKAFNENIRPEVAVSGTVVVGVAGLSAIDGKALDSAQVQLPTAIATDELCLRVTSRDGIYISDSVYALPSGAAGQLVRLPYKPASADGPPRSYEDTEIAMAATLGTCDTKTADYLVVRADDAPLTTIRLYLNAFGATDVFLSVGGPAESLDCSYIDQGRRTTFDFWCDIPVTDISEAPLDVTIERERFGRAQPDVRLRLIGATASRE